MPSPPQSNYKAIGRLPPRLGEHGREILQEAGLRTDEIEALAADGGLLLPAGKQKVT